MSHEVIIHGIQALALGFSIGLILLLIRRHAPGSGLRVWVLLAGLAGATWLVMQFLGIEGGATASRIALSATIILGTNMVLQLLNLLLWDYLLRRRGDIHIPRLVIDIINFIVLALVAVIVLNRVFGMQLTAFLVTSTVLSAVIGLSLQDILGNLFAGLALQMERPYSLGEWVSVGEKEGVVAQMNWRTLTIRTRPGDYVTIPNATISKEIVTNYSRPDLKHRCSVTVGLSYDHVPGDAKKALYGALTEVEGILDDPAPEVLLQQFDAYTINYDARFWISEFARRQQIEDAVRSRIWYCLQRAGLTIPYPIRNISMRAVSEDQEAKARENRRSEVIRELRKVDLFRSLNADQIADLADSSAKLLFGRGEILVHQGGGGDSLYLITAGEVDVSVSALPGESTHLATLRKGTYFGEMSLLTGEPRSATITANTETRVIRVEKAGLSRLLETESAILEPLSAMLEKRLADLSSRVRDHEESIASSKKPEHKENLLSRIRDFFGLG
jgi:small-conductance mechanosensitive channel/CRP-like cAMP-binding protein